MSEIYAAIDIGSNSVRLLIAKRENGIITPLFKGLRTTRLGKDLEKNGEILQENIYKTVEALNYFQNYIKKYDNIGIKAVATSALREAKNSHKVIQYIEKETGLKINVISGQEEAVLSYKGVLNSLDNLNEPVVVIDIGGGSTEIIFKNGRGQVKTSSSFVGAVRCTEKSSTPTEIFNELKEILEEVKKLKQFELVAVGGTATSLAAIMKKLQTYDPEIVHGTIIHLNELSKIMLELAGKSISERKQVPGLEPHRADIIVSGLLILWVIMTYLECENVMISEADILNGIILSM